MTLDAYSPCPCGSGKKVKFCCCKDFASDLSKVHRALEGDQHVSALDQIQRLRNKHGDRAALLAMQLEAQLLSGEQEKVEETVAALQAVAPENSSSLAFAAIAKSESGDVDEAVVALQRAVEKTVDVMSGIVFQAIGIVANRLLSERKIIAARRHFMVQAAIAGEQESDARTIFLRICQSESIPLLFKEDFQLAPPPADAPWLGIFQEALEASAHGAWLSAAEKLQGLAEQAPDEPSIQQNLAVLYGWLGREQASAEAWRRLAAAPNVPLDDAVEAEALAQLLDPQAAEQIDTLLITYPIHDVEKLMERLLSDRRANAVELDPAMNRDSDEPPPKAAFLALDRPFPASGEGLECDQVPEIRGQILVFGRQTDREARMELMAMRDEHFDDTVRLIQELTGDTIGEQQSEEVQGQIPASQNALSFAWKFPDDVSPSRREALVAERRQKMVHENWAETPNASVDGKRPSEVSGDPAYHVRLLAAILLMEIQCQQQKWEVDFDALRAKLGLPVPGVVEDFAAGMVPLVRLTRLPYDKLSAEELGSAVQRAAIVNYHEAVRRIALSASQRSDLDEIWPKYEVYDALAQNARDSNEALLYTEKARDAAVAAGESPATWLLRELSLRLGSGDVERAQELFRQIQTEHGHEPDVQRALYELLVSLGVVSLDDAKARAAQSRGAGEAAPPPAAGAPPQGGKLWTPGSPEPSADPGKKPVIWTPD